MGTYTPPLWVDYSLRVALEKKDPGSRKLSTLWEKGVEGWIRVSREEGAQLFDSGQNLVGEEKRAESRMTAKFQAAVIRGLSECRWHCMHWLPTPFLGCVTLEESLCSSESPFARCYLGLTVPVLPASWVSRSWFSVVCRQWVQERTIKQGVWLIPCLSDSKAGKVQWGLECGMVSIIDHWEESN